MSKANMGTEKKQEETSQADPSWKTLYRIGGVAALIEGIAYIMILVMGLRIGVAPGNTVNWLNALAAHPQLAVFDYGVVTGIADFALIAVAFALYFALRGVSKSWMLLATGMILVFVAIDISTFVSTSINLTWLTQNYAAAIDPTVRTAILGAEYSALSTIPLAQFIGWALWPIVFVIWIAALYKARFARLTRIFGIFTVLFSIGGGISFIYPDITYLVNLQLPALAVYSLFFFGLGVLLFGLAKKTRLE
jgi:hypothetical protein